MSIKKGDFVELDFVGRISGTKEIFDLTKENVAKENNLFNPKFSYKPVVICVGEGEIIKGLDEKLIGKDNGNYKIEIKTEDGFGKKNPSLLKLVPMKIFIKENLKPFPGLNINIDGFIGTVRTASGGRVIVDFNHPLSGKDLIFDIDIKRVIKEEKEQVESLLTKITDKFNVKIENHKLDLNVDLDDKHKELLKEKINKLVPSIKEIKIEKLDK